MAAQDQAMSGTSARPGTRPPPAVDGAISLALSGRLDALRALPLRAELEALVAGAVDSGAPGVLIDLSQAVFVDSAALAALVRLRRRCADVGLDLTLVKPRHPDAFRIFRLTQFDEVFVMIDSSPR